MRMDSKHDDDMPGRSRVDRFVDILAAIAVERLREEYPQFFVEAASDIPEAGDASSADE